jgi:hypothetical protein
MGAIFLDLPGPYNHELLTPSDALNGVSVESNSDHIPVPLTPDLTINHSGTLEISQDIKIDLPHQTPVDEELEVVVPNLITQVVRVDSPYKQNIEEARQRIILYKKNNVPVRPTKAPEPIPKVSLFSIFTCCMPSRPAPTQIEGQQPITLREKFLPPLAMAGADKKLLLLDLDETLVHSSFKVF